MFFSKDNNKVYKWIHSVLMFFLLVLSLIFLQKNIEKQVLNNIQRMHQDGETGKLNHRHHEAY